MEKEKQRKVINNIEIEEAENGGYWLRKTDESGSMWLSIDDFIDLKEVLERIR